MTFPKKLVALIVFLQFADIACAQPNPQGRTEYSTSFRSVFGQPGTAHVVLNGTRGTYSGQNASGQLYDVFYEFSQGNDWLINGKWRSSCGNFGGEFHWYGDSSTSRSFTGHYTSNERPGQFQWCGSQIGTIRTPIVHPQVPTTPVYGPWTRDCETGLYTRRCDLPGGGHQFLVYWVGKPNWIYWYNPVKKVYWCACPTKSHPRFGSRIAAGETLFLRCAFKSQRLSQCILEDECKVSSSMSTKNSHGGTVPLDNVPSDKPLI